MLTIRLPEWAAPLFKPFDYKILYGGRGSAKTWSMATALTIQGHQQPLRIACVRQKQNSLEESNKQTFEEMIDRMALRNERNGYKVMKEAIVHANGTRIFFRGISTTTEAAIKGWESVDRVWVEQAEMMAASGWEILKNTIRKPGAEIWLSLNPKNRYDPAYRLAMNPPANSYVLKVNYNDNPWFPDVLDRRRRDDERDNPERYPHLWLGEPDDVSAARKVLPYDLLRRCRDAWDRRPKPEGVPHAGLDVADTGADKNALAIRRMPVLQSVERWSAPTLGVTTRRAINTSRDAGAVRLYYDAGGVGAGVRSHLADMGTPGLRGFPVHFGGVPDAPDVPFIVAKHREPVTQKQYFKNAAAQMGWAVRLRAEQTKRLVGDPEKGAPPDPSVNLASCLFINPAIVEDVLAQMAQPEWDDDTGKLRIEKQPHGPGEAEPPSPDGYDSAILSFKGDCRRGLRRP